MQIPKVGSGAGVEWEPRSTGPAVADERVGGQDRIAVADTKHQVAAWVRRLRETRSIAAVVPDAATMEARDVHLAAADSLLATGWGHPPKIRP
jgi:hypothetical protein